MAETGLFYKLLPRQTYICKHKNRQSVGETKAVEAKYRVIGNVCTNEAGVKVPICIPEKSKMPRCFCIEKPPLVFLSQRDAWSDTTTLKAWFSNVFLPMARRYTSRPVSLIIDNCEPHETNIKDLQEQVEIMA